MIRIREDGAFERNDRTWVPTGFNYWPPESGVECWTDGHWSPEPFRRDFAAMAAMGFDCARMFLRWPEFQPEEGRVNRVALSRLAEVGRIAHDTGIMLIPTLFVGFMSGGLYPPPWLGNRNLFTDPECVKAAALLAMDASRVLAPTGSVLAYDFSNEINVWCNHLPPLTTQEAMAWQREMISAIRIGHPGALAMNGTNHTGIIAEDPWNLRAQSRVPVDILSMHVYPVRVWNPLLMASLQSYEADILAPVHVAMARAYGPVMMQEFGVAVPVGGMVPRNYLFQSVIGCWLDGSNGFLQWGWRDFTTRASPYRDNPFEKEICFLNSRGEMKEASKGYLAAVAFIRKLEGYAPRAPQIGIYLGDAYWEGPHATLNNSIRCFWLSASLRRAHLEHGFTERIDPRYKVIVVPGPRLNLEEISALRHYVTQGGRVVLANIGFNYWCDDLKELADVSLADMAHLSGDACVRGPGVEFQAPSLNYFPVAAPRGAKTIATIGEPPVPAVLVSDAGRGQVATLFVPLGPELCEHPARLLYHQLLGPLFAGWGILPDAVGLPPEVECRVLTHGGGDCRLVLLNHAALPFHGSMEWRGRKQTVGITAKGAAVLRASVGA